MRRSAGVRQVHKPHLSWLAMAACWISRPQVLQMRPGRPARRAFWTRAAFWAAVLREPPTRPICCAAWLKSFAEGLGVIIISL